MNIIISSRSSAFELYIFLGESFIQVDRLFKFNQIRKTY